MTQCAFSYLILKLNIATNTSKCHHSALTFPNFPGQIPPVDPPQERRAFGARRTACPTETHYYCHPPFYTNCLLTHHFNQATPLAIDLCQECSSAVSSFLVVNQSRNAMSFGHAEIVVVKTPTSGVTNDGNFVK